MPHFLSDDGVELYYEEQGPEDPGQAGTGVPIIFVHEFGGDWRSWRRQVAVFRAQKRCITPCARGFHPSGVPQQQEDYGQERATRDLLNLLDHLELPKAHLVGTSMGSYTSLCLVMAEESRAASLVLVGNSSGPRGPEEQAAYRDGWIGPEIVAREAGGGAAAVTHLAADPAYRDFQRKDPEGWADYAANLRGQAVEGALHILRSLHWNRVSLWDRAKHLKQIALPLLLVWGENDYYLVEETNRFLEALVRGARSAVFPETGHLVNIEEAEAFNRLLADFYAQHF